MRIVRHSVFETNSSSTHSLTFGKDKDFIVPDEPIAVKMRDMDYLYKPDPSYFCLPEYDQLKTMTTREVIDYVLAAYSADYDVEWVIANVSTFLDVVGIEKGYNYDTGIYYSGKREKEAVPALEYIKTAEYPQFDPGPYAPENDFQKKLEFLYCMALARGEKPVSYTSLSTVLKTVVDRAATDIMIEVPYIENCDENVLAYPDDEKYEGGYKNPEYQKEWDRYRKWVETWRQNLSRVIIPISKYSKKHYDRTLLEMSHVGWDYPLHMETHNDCYIGELRKMFRNKKGELVDWLFDKNSGFYRFRAG